MGEENSVQLESSMESDSTDLGILENPHVLGIESNDWVRSEVDIIVGISVVNIEVILCTSRPILSLF